MSMDFRIIENYSAHLVAGEEVEITEYHQICTRCHKPAAIMVNLVCSDCIAESRKQRIRGICEKGNFAISLIKEG